MVKRIDFHIHTVASKKDNKFTFSLEWLQNYVSTANLDAIAITNHDLFDKENYLTIKNALKNLNCEVYPGMELSLETGHVNIIFDVSEIDHLVSFSNWILKNKPDKNDTISVNEFTENMKYWSEGIYIFELGKSKSLKVPKDLADVVAVGGVSNQLRFQSTLWNKNELVPVLFSDAHASTDTPDPYRNNINLLKSKNTFLQIDGCSFEEIKNCISDRDKVAVNSDLLNDVIDINGHRVSTGLNLIVGKRGTGKTYFLEKVKGEYPKEDIYEIAQFETAKSEEFLIRYKKDQRIEAFENWKEKYSTQFDAIHEYINQSEDSLMNDLKAYLESLRIYAQDTVNSKSSAKYKLSKESGFEIVTKDSLQHHLEALRKLIISEDFWDYLSKPENKKEVFLDIYKELKSFYEKDEKEKHLKTRVNEIIKVIRNILSAKTGINEVDDYNYTDTVLNIKYKEAINSFLEEVITEDIIKTEKIHGYIIQVKISPYINARQFQSFHGINEAVNDDLIRPYKGKDFISFIKNLKQKKFYKPSNLEEYFMNVEVDLLDSYGTPASGGQAVGFSLILRLEEAKNKPIILIDEPEASLDNDFLKNELIDAIRSLKENSTVFVITHNSTLGTLLEQDYLIVTKKDGNKDYRVLTGSYKSKVISNKYQEVGSFDLFVDAMEAGFDTYEEKGDIYEFFKDRE